MSLHRNNDLDNIFSLFNSNNRNVLIDVLTILNDDNYETLLNNYIDIHLGDEESEESQESESQESESQESESQEPESQESESQEPESQESESQESSIVLNMNSDDMGNFLERNVLPSIISIGGEMNTENNIVEPLSNSMYDKFDRYRVWGWNSNTCSICLSKFKWFDYIIKLPCCNQEFHNGCMNNWFVSHSTCPLCRKNFNPENNTDMLNIINRVMYITRTVSQIIDYRISNQL